MQPFRFLVLICVFTGVACSVHSQQGNTWYFGDRAGLSFNTNPPTVLFDGQMATFEGCASISDNNGQILFYTDGVTIRNKLHQVMLNGAGLKGHSSATNSAIIVPRPGSDSLYYVITASAVEANNEGYFYSEVDMSLQGGLGAVTTVKNVLLYSPSTEKLTAVRHSNGIDVWVVTRLLDNTEWRSFKIDCNGINTTPVISFGGHPSSQIFATVNVGWLKSSPDGKKIAAVNTGDNFTDVFDFDASTGLLSNGLVISNPNRPFGVEFSPNSQLLYIGEEFTPSQPVVVGDVVQYSLANFDSTAIENSKQVIGTGISTMGALQMGPDHKIYCTMEFAPALGVINSPDLPGLACGFVTDQINLVDRQPLRSLPTFFPGLTINRNADFTFTNNPDCSISFSATTTVPGNVSWAWDFGDGTTGTGQNITHTYPPGAAINTVKLTVTSTGACGSAKVFKQVVRNTGTMIADFKFDKTCGNPTISFFDSSTVVGTQIQNWTWDFGDGSSSNQQNPLHTYATFGTFSVKLTTQATGGCASTSTIQKDIVIEPRPLADFTNSKGCEGQLVNLTDNSSTTIGNIVSWHWDLGDRTTSSLQNPQKIYAIAGTYNVKLVVTSSSGCISDTFSKQVVVDASPLVAFTHPFVCIDAPVQFTNNTTLSSGAIARYEWSFGDGSLSAETNPTHIYDRAGDFRVVLKAISDNGCESSADNIIHTSQVDAFAGNDTIVVAGVPFQLKASGGVQYQWSPPDFLSDPTIANPAATLTDDQRYQVTVTNDDGCSETDEISIHVIKEMNIYVPNAFSPRGKNQIFRPILIGIKELEFFSVYNRLGRLVFTTREQGKGWDGTINGTDQPTGVFVWMLRAKDYLGRVISKKGTVVLIR